MQRTGLLLLAASLLAAPSFAQDAVGEDEILRLRDGRLIVGEIIEHDLDGLVVVSALHGGRYRLAWSDLFPGEAGRLKGGFGYREETGMPEVLADRLLLKNGMQLTGRLLRDDGSTVELRVHDNVQRINADRLAAPPEQVLVPATEILTPTQFYAESVLDVPDDAMAQYDFAMELELVFALDQAAEHLAISEELAIADDDQALLRRLGTAQERIATKIANRAESEALQEIRHLMNRERFTQAEELLASFDSRFPNAALRGEFLDLSDQFDERRQNALERRVSQLWFNASIKVIKKASVRDRNKPVDAITDWLVGEVPQLIREEIAESLVEMKADLDPSEIDSYWMARFEHSPKRHPAGYGDGTWLLGEERALAGLETEEIEDTADNPQKEFEDRIKRYLDNLESARKSREGGDDGASPEDFWRKSSPTERFQWMLAYYAEFGGDYQIRSVSFVNCPTCGGIGSLRVTDINNEGSQNKKRLCPTCHGVSKRRKVHFH